MRFMIIIKGTPESEKEAPGSDPQLMADMGKYNEELIKAGIVLAMDGLQPSSKGARVKFSGKSITVIDGPFTEAKELVAGFWIWQVKSMDEAVEWARRMPNPYLDDGEVEIRPIFSEEDFGAALTPELREQQRSQAERLNAS